MNKFDPSTPEHGSLMKLKEAFLAEFGTIAASDAAGASTNSGQERVGGSCDYSIDGGIQPLDTARMIEPEIMTMDAFNKLDRRERVCLSVLGHFSRQWRQQYIVSKKMLASFPLKHVHYCAVHHNPHIEARGGHWKEWQAFHCHHKGL